MGSAIDSKAEDILLQPVPSSLRTPSEYTTTTTLRDDASTTAALISTAEFVPSKSLQIQSQGKARISIPSPSKELQIPIFSLTSSRPVYLSIRPARRSGNCSLVLADDEHESSIATTSYRFGPGKPPEVRIGRDDDLDADVFELLGKSLLTRTIMFESRRWGKFEWRYGDKRERAPSAAHNLLILEKLIMVEGAKESRLRVAQLVRSDVTRTPGTKASTAGNGGKLEMNLTNDFGQEVDEVTVVVTCLAMLKKEIDRQRAIQAMAISAAVSGAS